MTETKKVYVPKTFGNVKTFSNGGEVINIDFTDVKELKEFIDKNTVDNKFRIVVQKQKNDQSKASITLNTYVPKGNSVDINSDESDNLPF